MISLGTITLAWIHGFHHCLIMSCTIFTEKMNLKIILIGGTCVLSRQCWPFYQFIHPATLSSSKSEWQTMISSLPAPNQLPPSGVWKSQFGRMPLLFLMTANCHGSLRVLKRYFYGSETKLIQFIILRSWKLPTSWQQPGIGPLVLLAWNRKQTNRVGFFKPMVYQISGS